MPTEENLKAAFAGESQANRKYLAFAKKADQEGLAMVAKLFRATAEAETVHAHAHLKVLGEIRGTAENLQVAIDGESYEFSEMYPKFLEEAEAEGNKAAAKFFRFALDAEKVHHDLYTAALEAVGAGKDLDGAPVYLCPYCGHIVIGEPTENCPICNVPASKYVEMA